MQTALCSRAGPAQALAERRASGRHAGPSSGCQQQQRQRQGRCRAQEEGEGSGVTAAGSQLLDAIEEKENKKRGKKGGGAPRGERDAFSVPEQAAPAPAPKKKRPPAAAQAGAAEWREGQLLPEGWDKMNALQKAYELYTGKRGLLFWVNKLAYASIFVIIFGWIVFRFVLPGLGLYQLENDLASPPQL